MQLRRTLGVFSPAQRRIIFSRAFGTTAKFRAAERGNDVLSGSSRTRNIGIIAHIDAGKTTTTERMLFYSGYTRRIGNVDDGSTVTDFLPAEKARGVTIQSAAISFRWPLPEQHLSDKGLPKNDGSEKRYKAATTSTPHNINLIDTPGHADFTFEVLRSLRVLDGAICILDGVAGVEAQTEKVWYQAANYDIPKILYVNKLDRDGAAFGETVKQIATRLHTWPAVCQVPWWEGGNGRFIGLGDAVGLRALRWGDGGDGKSFDVAAIDEIKPKETELVQEVKKARRALVELLSENDDIMVQHYLEATEDHLAIPEEAILASLRRCVLNPESNIVPVLAGASFQNIGVQPLLDAVVQLLPKPEEASDPKITLGGEECRLSGLKNGRMLASDKSSKPKNSVSKTRKASTALIDNLDACALAFKVVHDPRRGALVYVRVYSGTIARQSLLFNTNLQLYEKVPQLLKMYASDAVQIDSIPAGQIGVIPGLKHTRTGDTLISYAGTSSKTGPPAPLNTLELRPIEVPPAVFFCSIEPHSLGEEKAVKAALGILIREDPSLQVSVDEESGQTLLSGMGELHLEIARDRLVNDLKAKASMGNIEIAYRESVLRPSQPDIYAFEHEQGGKQGRASCAATVEPLVESSEVPVTDEYGYSTYEDGNRITITLASPADPSSNLPPWNGELSSHLSVPLIHNALKNGALAALSRGINHPFPIHSTHIHLTLNPRQHLFGTDSTPAALSSAARQATKAALKSTALEHGSALLELVMNVTVTTDEASLGAVVNDISSSRGGHILSLDDSGATSGSTVNSTTEPLPRIDLNKVYAPPDPFGASPSQAQEQGLTVDGGRQRNITARVPLKEMVGYLKHLRSLTGGRGTFVMSADRFERVVGQREKVLLRELRGF